MCTEDVWTWPDGTDYASRLAADLEVTSLVLRYNTGLAIADNGAALATLLDQLVAAYPAPLEELVLVGYSMGGLVVRSACHVAATAGSTWLGRVRRSVYVGTPHQGAPLERAGRVLTRLLATIPDPYTRLAAQLGDLRSDGIKDLGDADLRHEDRARRRATLALRDPRHPVPLLPELAHYLVAGSVALDPRLTALFGDALVPVASGTDGRREDATFPADRVVFVPGIDHLALAHHPEVYVHLRRFCAEALP
jgi:pimeloyl-ACP methyl ester carboxylesterase